jgi:WD40 repeat protein
MVSIGKVAVATAVGNVEVIDLGTKEKTTFSGHTGRVNCVAADGDLLVSGGADSFVCCWRTDKSEHARVPSFREEILCVAVSKEFTMAVAGTRDGALLWIATTNGAITRVVQLEKGEVPRKVMITPEWGFVVVDSQAVVDGRARHTIAVYSVNGEKVRTRTLDRAVLAWCCWDCRKGFDHALLVDDAGTVFPFEVFWLDIRKPIDVCPPPDSITFVKEEGVYVIIGREGIVPVKSWEDCCKDGILACQTPS